MNKTISTIKESKGVTYYWNELKNLSSDEKQQIIMLLSSSLGKCVDNSVESAQYTKEMLDRFSGAWVGEESADEIIDNINKSKKSHTEPVQLK